MLYHIILYYIVLYYIILYHMIEYNINVIYDYVDIGRYLPLGCTVRSSCTGAQKCAPQASAQECAPRAARVKSVHAQRRDAWTHLGG